MVAKNVIYGARLMINSEELLDYVSEKVIEKHKTCLENQFDNGYFWAMKELQSLILKGEFDDNQ
jgi:hypothetical protein